MLIGIAALFWIVGMGIWSAMGEIVANPPDGSKSSYYSYLPYIPYHKVEAISVACNNASDLKNMLVFVYSIRVASQFETSIHVQY